MKIKNVTTLQLYTPLAENSYPAGRERVGGWGSILVQIDTDGGIVGLGEAGEHLYLACSDNSKERVVPTSPGLIRYLIDRAFKGLLIGEDPVNIDKLRYKLLSSIIERVDRRSLGDAIIEALSGIDIALWDIKGKVLGRPIYDLLGGIMKDKVRMYASAGLHEDPEEIAREAKKIRQEGFTAYKMRIHGEFARDLERVRTAYESLGDNTSLMIDVGTALHSWKAEHTIRFSKEVEKFNVFWLEDPVPRFDYNGLEKVRKFVNIPIAMGEQYLLMEDFKEMVVKYLIDYAQPDVVRCGGVSECKKIAAFADAWGIKYVPHSWESAIAQIANLHVVASSPNGIMIEYAKIYNPLLTEITKGKLKIENGYLCVPTSPGLGIELDEKALNRFLISSSE